MDSSTNQPKLFRGAIPTSRHELAASIPHEAKHVAPPNFIIIPQKISMWGNNQYRDCVTAEEAFAKACHNPTIFFNDAYIIDWATKHGVLNGATLTQVMNYMQTDGFTQTPHVYKDGGYFSVDWTKDATLKSAISLGPVKIGIAANQIEKAYQSTGGKSGWFATGFHADPNEDHCVSLCGYGTISWLAQHLKVHVPNGVDGNKTGFAMFTWDSIGIIDEPSLLAITHEAWLRNPTTIIIP